MSEKVRGRTTSKPEPDSAPVELERLVREAEHAGASDIHIQMVGREAKVLYRLDGVMNPAGELPEGLAERVIGRIKFLARLKTYQESLPQDGRIERSEIKSRTDIRVATYPTVTGEKVVLRLFVADEERVLENLDFPEMIVAELEQFLRQSAGLMLLTGPAGSGKTTTIFACLRHIAKGGGRHIITVEDPVEQIIPGVMQTEVNEARGLDFAKAARHLLRQDPQVLMIGEIRDEETANIALRAALTGHLVISTLHAGSCKGVFERLQVMCRDYSAMLTSIGLVLNQRLCRRLCFQCMGKGCRACMETGYRGRVPIVEYLRVDEGARRSLAAREFEGLIPKITLDEAGRVLIASGMTDQKELERVV